MLYAAAASTHSRSDGALLPRSAVAWPLRPLPSTTSAGNHFVQRFLQRFKTDRGAGPECGCEKLVQPLNHFERRREGFWLALNWSIPPSRMAAASLTGSGAFAGAPSPPAAFSLAAWMSSNVIGGIPFGRHTGAV